MDILGTALSVLVILVVTHIAVFWVVRTLYPPAPTPPPAPAPVPVEVQQTFTQPTQVQHVTIPTYEAPVQLETSNQERGANFTNTQSSTIQRDPGLASVDPRRNEPTESALPNYETRGNTNRTG